MKNVLRILFAGIAVGAFVMALLTQAERKRLKTELAFAWKTANERAILPPNLDEILVEERRISQQINWERDALGLNREDDDDESLF